MNNDLSDLSDLSLNSCILSMPQGGHAAVCGEGFDGYGDKMKDMAGFPQGQSSIWDSKIHAKTHAGVIESQAAAVSGAAVACDGATLSQIGNSFPQMASMSGGNGDKMEPISKNYYVVHSGGASALAIPDIETGSTVTIKTTRYDGSATNFTINFPAGQDVETYVKQGDGSIRPYLKVIKGGVHIMANRGGSVTYLKTTIQGRPTWLIMNEFGGNSLFKPMGLSLTSDVLRSSMISM